MSNWSGHITLYGNDHDVLCWRAFYTKEGVKRIMEVWTKQYSEQAAYFQIWVRPKNEKVIIEQEKVETFIRPKSVYQNIKIYNYDK